MRLGAMEKRDWQWDEMQQVGTDYTDPEEIEKYDNRMATIRDVEAENSQMLAMLALPADASVLEIGCGTGRFARAAAANGLKAAAADVSAAMLEYVGHRAKADGLRGLETRHAGFLTLDFPDSSFDAVVSGAALHHLPDAWKLPAMLNVARMLKPGGQLILRDVVFVLNEGETPEMCFERLVNSMETMKMEVARHVAKEFSTYDWIMDGILARAGFQIVSKTVQGASFIVYHCRKA